MKISCDFWELASVTRNRGRKSVIIEPSGGRCLDVIYFTLMTS